MCVCASEAAAKAHVVVGGCVGVWVCGCVGMCNCVAGLKFKVKALYVCLRHCMCV